MVVLSIACVPADLVFSCSDQDKDMRFSGYLDRANEDCVMNGIN
jgi:hypothetical protein